MTTEELLALDFGPPPNRTPEQEAAFEAKSMRCEAAVLLLDTKCWAESRTDWSTMMEEESDLDHPSPSDRHPFWCVKVALGSAEDEAVNAWARGRAAELPAPEVGCDWVALVHELLSGPVGEEARRSFPEHEREAVGILFFHLMGLVE